MDVKTKDIPLSNIKPNPKNPRLIKDDKYKKLVQSLKEFPEMKQIREIVVDENMEILGGNMRFKAMKELGEKTALVKIVTGLTENQKQEFIIKDNQPYGSWDMDFLANDFVLEDLLNWGFEKIDFNIESEKEINDLSNTLSETFEVVVECVSEREQEKIYNNLTSDGYKCRILTL